MPGLSVSFRGSDLPAGGPRAANALMMAMSMATCLLSLTWWPRFLHGLLRVYFRLTPPPAGGRVRPLSRGFDYGVSHGGECLLRPEAALAGTRLGPKARNAAVIEGTGEDF